MKNTKIVKTGEMIIMSINMYIKEVRKQTKYANKLAVAYRNYAEKIDNLIQFYYDSQLTSSAYDTNKEYFLRVYTPLSKGLKLVCSSLMDAHYLFPLMYESNVYTKDIIEDDLKNQIKQGENFIYALESYQRMFPSISWFLEKNIELTENMVKMLKQRLTDFYEFNEASSRIFDDVNYLITKVEKGLELVESGVGYDVVIKRFDISGLDLSWAEEIDKIAVERKNKTTMREKELEAQGQVFKDAFKKKQYVDVEIYGRHKMMWLDNPPYYGQVDLQFNDNYQKWLSEMADLYGKEAIYGESKDIDPLSQMALEASKGIDYYTGIKLTKTEILQRKVGLLSYGANLGIGMYWTSYSGKIIKEQEQVVVTEKGIVKEVESQSFGDKNLLNELKQDGAKYNIEDVIMITKTPDGKLLWLEKGNSSAGYQHIINGHITDFANKGITN